MTNNSEYLFLKCEQCKEQVKIAKNKGAYWKTFNPAWISDFLLYHSGCDRDCIKVHWED